MLQGSSDGSAEAGRFDVDEAAGTVRWTKASGGALTARVGGPPVGFLRETRKSFETGQDKEPAVVAFLEARMQAWIAKREKETGRTNPMYTHLHWHGSPNVPGPFESSQQAYDTLHIGNRKAAQKLQARDEKKK